MKKIILLGIIIFMFLNFGFSQNFNALIVAGTNTSQIDGDDYAGFQKLNGLCGLAVKYNISENLAIQPGFMYIGKGSKNQEKDNSGVVLNSFKIHLHYIEVPFQIRYIWKKLVFCEAGVAFAYLFSSKMKENDYVIDKSMYNLKSFEYSVNLAVGFQITAKIGASVRFSNTIPLPAASISNHESMPNWFNRNLALVIAYKLNAFND